MGESDGRSYSDDAKNRVGVGSQRIWKCVIDITTKVIANEDNIELSAPLG